MLQEKVTITVNTGKNKKELPLICYIVTLKRK
jgi:hypothetical protein